MKRMNTFRARNTTVKNKSSNEAKWNLHLSDSFVEPAVVWNGRSPWGRDYFLYVMNRISAASSTLPTSQNNDKDTSPNGKVTRTHIRDRRFGEGEGGS